MPPRSPLTLSLALKVGLDETFAALRKMLTRSLGRDDWVRIATEVRAAEALYAAQGWLEAPARYHVAPPPLVAPRLRRARSRGFEFKHLQFVSGYEPHANEPGRERWLAYRPNRTAHAWVLQHRGKPRPWLVCVHGLGMGAPLVDLMGFQVPWLYHSLGLNVLLPVLPFHGPRAIGWKSGDGFVSGDCLDLVHAVAQSMWDLRRLLSWVRDQDALAVGLYGLSLGGYSAALLSGLERDLACVIAGIPATDFVRLAQLHTPAHVVRGARALGLDWDCIQRVFRVISPLVLPSRVPRARRYLFAGTMDRLVPPAQVHDLWKHWDRPHITWYHGSHMSFYWEPSVQALLRKTLRAELCSLLTSPNQPTRSAACAA